jgi:hypothetical protein
MYCNACKETFCQDCLTFFHRKEEKKNHLKEDISPVNKMNFKCSVHNTKKLKTFCIDCKSFLCDDCLVENSNNHKFHELKEMNDKTIDFMIKYTSNAIKERILNEKKNLRSQFDEIYERKLAIVNPLNFYVSKMLQWDNVDQLNVPLSHQLFSMKKDFLMNPEEKFTKIEHSLFLESEEILKAREDIKPLFSPNDEFHKEHDELFYQWANKIVYEGKQNDVVGNFHKFEQKPTKHLMDNTKLLKESFHVIKHKSTKDFSLIAQFDSFSHFTEIEIYENFNAGALKKIEVDYSMNEPSIFNWNTVWMLNPRTMNFKCSRIYKPALSTFDIHRRAKFFRFTFDISPYQLNSNYQIAGICLVSKKEHHPIQTISMGNSLFSDVNLFIKDGDKTVLIKSHKLVLCKSLKFSNVLSVNPNLEEIRIECPLKVFLKILNWMYCGKLVHEESSIESIRKICIHFEISELFSLLHED